MTVAEEYANRCHASSDISDHLPRLYELASRPGVRVIELGVRSGNSTAAFLLAAEENDGHVWSVDVTPVRTPFAGHDRWTFIHGDDLSPDVLVELPVEVDVVFIDTSHHYLHTAAELTEYAERVQPGGVIVLHDTDVERPYKQPPNEPSFPVRVAVEEFCERRGWPVEWVPGCFGLAVITASSSPTGR